MVNTEDARKEIANILDGKEYQMYQPRSKGFFEALWDHIEGWIADLLMKLLPSVGASSGLASTILIVLIIIVIVILFIVVFLSLRRRKRNRIFHDNQPLTSKNEMQWSYLKHLNEAESQGELGEYTRSTRHLFLALLLYFHEKEWLLARIWKTNWDYYEELQKVSQSSANKFYNLALLFDEITYGERLVDHQGYLQYQKEVLSLIEKNN
ncbi:hypothetical protein [Litchfieldia alkalitelluris]|uniref:hypothetical protein n=1 Tax=Litchfieldia alkalitelluris TaxID=304268 RepID=UPI0009975614|nr:hypothetical protein [Litchfieldia alkalitelluris]